MSKRNDRKAAERQTAEDAELRALLAEQDARWQARAEQDRQRNQELLAEFQQQFARDRLEAEAADLAAYRQQAVAQALSSKAVAPQFADFIDGTTKEEIDARLAQAKASTAGILAEVSGQMTTSRPSGQLRDDRGRFVPAEEPADPRLPQGMTAEEYAKAMDGSLSMNEYVTLRSRLNLGHRDGGLFQ